MTMGGGEVTARNLALGLAAISPLTGPAAPIVAGAALGLGLGILMALAITAVQERYGTEGVQGAVDLQGLYATVTNQPGVGVELANAGYEALFLQSRLLRDLQVRTNLALASGNLPYFAAPDDARAWRDYILQISGSGVVTSERISAALTWSSVEVARLGVGVSQALQVRDPTAYLELSSPPMFSSVAEAEEWRLGWEQIIQAGELTDPGPTIVFRHYQSEAVRLTAVPPVTIPPVTIPPVTIPPVTVPPVTIPPVTPPVAVVPPELLQAIADLQVQLALLQVSGTAREEQIVALSTQIAALSTQVATIPQTETMPADVRQSLVGLAPALAGTGVGSLAGSIASTMSATAGPNAHSAQMARYTCQGSFSEALLRVATTLAPSIAAGVILATDNPIRGRIQELIDGVITAQINMADLPAPASEVTAHSAASKRLTQAISLGLEAQAIAYTAEAMTPLKQMGFGQLAGFIGGLAGFDRISAGLMGTIEDAAIYQPLRWAANRRYRPRLPNEQILELMYQKRSLTEAELRDYLERLGLDETIISRTPTFIFNDPNPGLLIRAFQMAEPPPFHPSIEDQRIMVIAGIAADDPDAYLKLKFAKSGLDDTDVNAFVPVVRMGILRREQTLRYSQIERMYREGFITRARAESEIIAARVPAPTVAYRLAAMDLQREYEVAEDLRQLTMAMLSRGIISRGQAVDRLTALGMDSERVQVQVLRALVNLAPRSAAASQPPAEGVTTPIPEED